MKQCRGQMSMFSAEASLDLASRSASPGSEEARRMTVTSGLKCLELYRNSGPLGSLVRMLLGSSIWRSTRCTLIWKTKVTPSKRLLFRLVPSTPRTGETGVQLLPTVTAADYRRMGQNSKQQELPEFTKMWPTPTAGQCGMTAKTSGRTIEKSTHLTTQVYLAKKLIPTPISTDCKNCGGKHGRLQTHVGGQLNPDWVEWLMGFPVGWTEE